MAAAPSTTAAADTGASAPVSATAAKPAPIKAKPAPVAVQEPEPQAAPPAVADPATPLPEAIVWPVTVNVVNRSGIPLSLTVSGLFVGPASRAAVVLHSASHAREIRSEVDQSARASYIADQVEIESFPNFPE